MKQYEKIAKEVLDLEAKILVDCSKRIGDEINQAVDLIDKTTGKLIITGVGKSGLVGAKIAATFASTGTPSFFLHPTEAMHGDLGMLSSGDSVIAISNSGESEELVKILPHLKRMKIPLIGMSGRRESNLGKYSDVFLDISVEKEACPLNSAPTTSTTLTMAMGDVLAVCMMEKMGFQKEDFASFHPGGSLGRELFVKAIDVARRENLPVINKNATIKDAIEIMTNGKLGNAIIIEDKKVIGILSDGDLRRALMEDSFSLDNEAVKYATLKPKTIKADNLLASKALQTIEEAKIQILILVDENEEMVGVLHIHDLIEAGFDIS
ncbi:MAG: KpsF/GutQ family sugar-phosphate isomerase [Campylobacterales bacterium]|nr:KpsF/GutQ family sugar-phosphate isomerase [Campylobacterales bacterium]